MAKINDEYDIGLAFEAIENELIASMMRNMDRHQDEEEDEKKRWSMWQTEQLKALERYKKKNAAKYGKQFKDINGQIEEMIRAAKDQGNMDQEIKILQEIKRGFPARKVDPGGTGEFFKLNKRKLDALIKATTNDMEKAETAVLRMANDQYRKIIFNAQVYANTGAGTYEKAVDMATRDFLAAGLNCVEYANGARHTLADYADMAIRTASKRAYLQGEGEKRQEWGIATVIMNKRGNPCPLCLPFVGKVMMDDVWSGGPKDGISRLTGVKYPLMSKAVEAGLYHPRCRDAHTTYFEGINTASAQAKSGRVYTREEWQELVDRQREENREQYARRQEKKYERMAEYSLDPENRQRYVAKQKAWKSENTPVSMDRINEAAQESILKAYDARREHFNLNETPAEKLRKTTYNPVTANYTGISEKTAQKFNQTIQDLSDEYYSGITKIRVEDKKKMLGVQNFATTSHNNVVGQKELILNPLKMGDYDSMVGRIEELSKKGYCVDLADGTADRYIATHEFAHGLIDMESPLKNYIGMDTKPQKKIRKEIKNLFEEYKESVRVTEENLKLIKKDRVFTDPTASSEELMEGFKRMADAQNKLKKIKISTYSMENADEFMAEAFAQAKLGTSQSEYSKKVMKILDQNFKRQIENTSKVDIIEMNLQTFANVPKEKLIGYALNPDHPVGKEKARAFKVALGYIKENSEELREKILELFDEKDLVLKREGKYGKQYEQIMKITGPNGKTANVLTAWIKENESSEPRLVSVYVTEKEGK